MTVDLVPLLVALVLGLGAGYGWGRASMMTRLVDALAAVEIARVTGRAPEGSLVAKAIARLTPSQGSQKAGSTEPAVDRDAAIERGAAELLADAKGRGVPLSAKEARAAAADMLAEAGL